MTDRTKDTVRWWLTVGGAIAAIVFFAARLESQMLQLEQHKADRSEVIALRTEVEAMRRMMENEFRIQRIILCDNARVKSDTYCR